MTDEEFKKQGAVAREFYKKQRAYSKEYMYFSLWRELIGLLETELFKHPK